MFWLRNKKIIFSYSYLRACHYAGEAYSRVGLKGTVYAVCLTSFVHSLCYCINMSMPGEVMANVHSEVFSTIHYFECVPMELVF